MATSRRLSGIKVRYYRQKAKKSLKELAEDIGITKQYLSDIERGKINCCSDYLDIIIRKLNISAFEFHFKNIPVDDLLKLSIITNEELQNLNLSSAALAKEDFTPNNYQVQTSNLSSIALAKEDLTPNNYQVQTSNSNFNPDSYRD